MKIIIFPTIFFKVVARKFFPLICISQILVILCLTNILAQPNDGQIPFLRREANRGDPYSMYRLGRILYESGTTTEGLELIKKSCDYYNELYACEYLKSINSEIVKPTATTDLVQPNEGQISFLRGEASRGDPYSMYRLGRILYESGTTTEGLELIKKSCDYYNELYACEYLKSINSELVRPIPPKIPSNDELIEYYNSQVKKGDPFAMYRLGKILYDKGDESQGIKLLTRACNEYKESHACMFLDDINKKNIYAAKDGKNENKTNKVIKGVEKNTTYATVDNLSKNKKDTTHNQSTIEKRDIFCEYTDVKDKSVGISTMSMGATTGIPWLDGLNTIVGLIDDARDYFHTHTYICSYSPIREGQDTEFRKDIDNKDIKYIVFFNGALKNYYKLYSTHQVREHTIYPKTTVDYIGVIDKNNKLLRLDAVRDGKIHPWTAADLPKLKNYKLE